MATYYIDYVNGNDSHDGTREPASGTLTADSGTGESTIVDAALEKTVNGAYNGDWVYNVTRSAGRLVTNYDAGTKTLTLASSITGQAAGDSYYILKAWRTLPQFTSATVRSAGDKAYVRANQTHSYTSDVYCNDDGTLAAFIHVKGASAADDPWGDGSDVRPVLNFGGTTARFYLGDDNYWKLERLDLRNSANQDGALYLMGAAAAVIKNCIVRDCAETGVKVNHGHYELDGCELHSNTTYNLLLSSGSLLLKDCVFNGGSGTQYGLAVSATSIAEMRGTTFGQTTAHGSADIYQAGDGRKARMVCRNCAFSTVSSYGGGSPGFTVYSEDHGQVKDAHKTFFFNGIVQRNTNVLRTGGGPTSIKAQPNGNVSVNYPIMCMEWEEYDVPASSQLRTVYIVGRNWTSFPSAAELWFEAEYYDEASGTSKAVAKSSQTLTMNEAWTSFQVSFPPGQVGRVRYRVWLAARYGTTAVIHVDNKLYS